jgi:hypothetical protein
MLQGRSDLVEHVLAMLDPVPERRPTCLANWVAQLRRSSLVALPGDVALAPRAPGRNPDGGVTSPASHKQAPRPHRHSLPRVAGFLLPIFAVIGLVALRVDSDSNRENRVLGSPDPTTSTRANSAIPSTSETTSVSIPAAAPIIVKPPSSTSPSTGYDVSGTPGQRIFDKAQPVDLMAGGPPPWIGPPIGSGNERVFAIKEWISSNNSSSVRLVLPAATSLSGQSTIRSADFGGDWALAWDDPGQPGSLANGADCSDCGRSVMGVASGSVGVSDATRGPIVVQWNDGSAVSYGASFSPDPASTRYTAFLYIAGQASGYQIWSSIGQEHLEYLISELRFVQGAP